MLTGSQLEQALLLGRPDDFRASGLVKDHSSVGDVRPLQPGRAVLFDGVDDRVDTTFALGAVSAYTISFRFRTTDAGKVLVEMVDSTTDLVNLFVSNSGDVRVRHNNLTAILQTAGVYNDDAWHVATLTWDGATIVLRVDDEIVSAAEASAIDIAANLQLSPNSNYAGHLFDVRIYDRALTATEVAALHSLSAKSQDLIANSQGLVAHYKLDEEGGTTCYDSSGNANHGTAVDVTLGTFRYTGGDVPFSWQNEVGYSEVSGVANVPRDESNHLLDAAGNPLQHAGRAPRDGQIVDTPCPTFDGVDDFLDAPHLAGSESVVSSGGTSTPTISAGRIDFTAGTCWDLLLSDGTHYPLSEGAGTTHYDVSGAGNHATATNTDGSYWNAANYQDVAPYNVRHGFDDVSGAQAPALLDGTSVINAGQPPAFARHKLHHGYSEKLRRDGGDPTSPWAVSRGVAGVEWAPGDGQELLPLIHQGEPDEIDPVDPTDLDLRIRFGPGEVGLEELITVAGGLAPGVLLLSSDDGPDRVAAGPGALRAMEFDATLGVNIQGTIPVPATGSLCAWMRPASATQISAIGAIANDGDRCFLGWNSDRVAAGIGSDDWGTIQGASAGVLNQWTHGVVTFDGANVTLLVDGVEVYNAAQAGSIPTDWNFFIAALMDGTPAAANEWDGRIADVRIYSRVLPAAEAAALFAQGPYVGPFDRFVAVDESYATTESSRQRADRGPFGLGIGG